MFSPEPKTSNIFHLTHSCKFKCCDRRVSQVSAYVFNLLSIRLSRVVRFLIKITKRIAHLIFFYYYYLQETEAQCVWGMLLYSLDCLYQAVETHAKATGEWQWLVSYFSSLIRIPFHRLQLTI